MMRSFTLAAVVSVATAGLAAADTAYIEPSTFAPQLQQTITVEAAFNDHCCIPKYPVRSQAYAVVRPDGTMTAPDRMEVFSNSTVLEHTLTETGTTRFTTGERLGRKGGEYVFLKGVYHMVNSEDAPPIEVPEGTPILSSQTATLSDTYVTIGEPTDESRVVVLGRLLITPDQHPSTLRAEDALDVTLTFDGAPLVDQVLVLTRSGQKDRPGDEGVSFVSDADGRVSIPLESLGTHLLMTRMQAAAPEGAATDIRSYTTALTFDVAAR